MNSELSILSNRRRSKFFSKQFFDQSVQICANDQKTWNVKKYHKNRWELILKAQLSEYRSYSTFSKAVFSKISTLKKSTKETTTVTLIGFKITDRIPIFDFIPKKYHTNLYSFEISIFADTIKIKNSFSMQKLGYRRLEKNSSNSHSVHWYLYTLITAEYMLV